MYAIKINWEKFNSHDGYKPKLITGSSNEYVDEGLSDYTDKESALTWKTEKEASENLTEAWEEVVEI